MNRAPLACGLALTCLVLLNALAAAQAPEPQPLEDFLATQELVAAWEGRSSRVQSFYFSFIESYTRRPAAADSPFQVHTLVRCSGWDGRRFYYEVRGQPFSFDGQSRTWHTWDRILAIDDNMSRSLAVYPNGFQHGGVAPMGRNNIVFNTLSMMPLYFTYRGLTPEMGGFRFDQFHDTGRRGAVGGVECEIVTLAGTSQELWVDPAADYVVRRYRSMAHEEVRTQLDIDYERDETWGWVPTSWSFWTGDGAEHQVTVLLYEINPDTDAVVELEFPPGTLVEQWLDVLDGRQPDQRVRPPQYWRVDADLSRQSLTMEEVGPIFDRKLGPYLGSSPGELAEAAPDNGDAPPE